MIGDRISAAVILLFSGTAFYLAGGFPFGSQLFPRLVCVVMFLAGCGLMVRSFIPRLAQQTQSRVGDEDDEGNLGGVVLTKEVAVGLAATAAYAVSVPLIGFVTATAIFVPATAFMLGERDWRWLLFATVGFVVISAVLFLEIFQVPLPPEKLLLWF